MKTADKAMPAAATAVMATVPACCEPRVVGSRFTEGAMHITVTLKISRQAITNWKGVTRKRGYSAINAAASKRGWCRITIYPHSYQRRMHSRIRGRSSQGLRAGLRERSIQICPRGRHSAAEPTRLDSAP